MATRVAARAAALRRVLDRIMSRAPFCCAPPEGMGGRGTLPLLAGAWRLVPDEVGSWNSLYKRFARWQEKGVWQALLDRLAADGDLEWVMLDSTVVRTRMVVSAQSSAPIMPIRSPFQVLPGKRAAMAALPES